MIIDTEFKGLPFELGFLALLTSRGIKPLSRWEGSLSVREMDALAGLGLEVAGVRRYTLFGRKAPAVVLSKSGRYIDAYLKRFDERRLSRAARIQRLEGWFFGYPSCCVEAFVRRPYVKNGLAPEDQRILFHWACPGCHSTESLLREYRLIHAECVRIFGHGGPAQREAGGPGGRRRREMAALTAKALPWAASVAALVFLNGIPMALNGDPHQSPALDDSDMDGLSYREEMILGSNAMDPDCDTNGVLDGADESLRLGAIIAALPREPIPDGPYALDYPMDGVEQCAVCGEWIDMGFIKIVHPLRGLEADIPYIGIHYIEHGNLGYSGSIHKGRADVELLKKILYPFDPAHLIGGAEIDGDGDRLDDREEPLLSTDPLDEDTDDDSLDDGCQIAEELVAALGDLPRTVDPTGPYLIEHPAFGLEVCAVCGEIMNMGGVEIVNPLEQLTLSLPYVALHYLGHGGFCYSGDVHPSGRTLPVLLSTVLYGTGHSHEIPIPDDDDSDGLSNDEEIAIGYDPDNPDFDLDGTPDGPDLALFLHDALRVIPDGPLPDRTHKIHHLMRGHYDCLICGAQINMGFMEIVDPARAKTAIVTYYNDHFMEHGCFSTDRPDLYPRQDIAGVIDVLGVTVSEIGGETHPPGGRILSNAPNPFSASTRIVINLPEEERITVSIYDVNGAKVRELFAGEVRAGRSSIEWDGRGERGALLPSGVYFCRLNVGAAALSCKMLKVR